MQFYKHNFIGDDLNNCTVEWVISDTLEIYKTHLKNLTLHDWYYRDKKIDYFFNSTGHRSNDVAAVDLDNYIVTTGCSNTVGVGLELEKTYSYLLSNKLNCDYYNLGLGASGIDLVVHNLIIWLNVVKKQPKAIVIQWPDYTRCAVIKGINSNIITRGIWNRDPNTEAFLVNGIDINFFYSRKVFAERLLKTIVSCPIINFNIGDQTPFSNENNIQGNVIDFARDLMHPGIESNKQFAETLYAEIDSRIR